MKWTFIIYLLTFNLIFAQSKKKTFQFTQCDTIKDFDHDVTLNTDIKSTDKEITAWLNENASGTSLNMNADLYLVFDKVKGVCCKRFTVYDSTKANIQDFMTLVLKLKEHPEFIKLARNSTKSKILEVVIYQDKETKSYQVGLMPYFIDK